MENEEIEYELENLKGQLEETDENARIALGNLQARVEKLEELDLRKALLKGEEFDLEMPEQNRIVAKRIEDILTTTKTLNALNEIKRDAIIDYLAKKSGVNKTQIMAFLKSGRQYLDKLI